MRKQWHPCFFLCFFIVLVGFGTGRLSRADRHSEEAPRFTFYRAVIENALGFVEFQVELALTPDERARGLQYRKSLDLMSGMLFDFGENRPVAMWMRNTGISLDMLFIEDSGRIAHIVTDTKPFSLYRIPSPKPVRAVLEIPCGTVKKFGIAVGDHMVHPDLREFR